MTVPLVFLSLTFSMGMPGLYGGARAGRALEESASRVLRLCRELGEA